MRLNRGTDYGARGLIYLASLPQSQVVLVSEIAQAEDLPESYLAKIFQDLAKSGIVRSHRGAHGGFSLARPATEITLRQVVETLEGPIALSRCLLASEFCDQEETCSLRPVLAEAQERLLSFLESTSFADLATNARSLQRLASSASFD